MTGYFIRIIKTRRRRARELLPGIRMLSGRILLGGKHSLPPVGVRPVADALMQPAEASGGKQ